MIKNTIKLALALLTNDFSGAFRSAILDIGYRLMGGVIVATVATVSIIHTGSVIARALSRFEAGIWIELALYATAALVSLIGFFRMRPHPPASSRLSEPFGEQFAERLAQRFMEGFHDGMKTLAYKSKSGSKR